ncbi:biopolymer transporter ExbD [Psychromonas sp. RZ22]|uniref:ExbD/TolR family protein n=1 Tax=Psychromonas algarum TaxID=2555643 RepID=UPI00106792C7|nr:biopolymer transporter ExbD [Psychromonas sp. RZ22]TEW54159.1 biopolymer transporter ExbD [Psychromonas sp. RZ22]
MIRSQKQDDEQSLQVDLTPLLDIIFIVMVFLMLTANIELQSLQVDLPTTDTSAAQVVDEKVVTINLLNKEPRWAIDGELKKDWPDFQQQLIQQVQKQPKTQWIIAADKSADVQYMVQLLAFLQKHNIQATQLLIDKE